MGTIFRQDGINSMILEINGASSVVYESLNSVKSASEEIAGRDDWQGKKATAVKEYMEHAHGAIIASIGLLMKDIYDQAMLYQKGYYDIDGDAHAVISEQELEDLKTRMTQMGPVFDTLDTEAQRIIRSISQIRSIPYAGVQQLPEALDKLAEKTELLITDIGNHENDFQTRFQNELELISSLKGLIREARSTRLETFSAQAMAQSKNYQKVVLAYQNLAGAVEANAEKVKAAELTFQQTYKVLEQEYQERVEKAKKAKFWTGVLTAVVSAVVITATGGAGVVLVGAAAGAINAGVGSYFDQQIGSVGYPGSVDWGKTFLDAAVGGAIGAATSYVGASFGAATSGLKATGVKLFAEKVGMEGLKSVTSGVIERGGRALYDSVSAGKSFSDVLSDTASSAFDVKEMVGDFVGGCAGGAFVQGVDFVSGKIEGKLFSGANAGGAVSKGSDIMIKADAPSYSRQAYGIMVDTAKETGKGITKRFSGTLAKTGDFSSAVEAGFDKNSILQDAASAFGSNAAAAATADVKVAIAQHRIDKIEEQVNAKALEENQANEDICAERGLNRTKIGTPDYKDRPECTAETEMRQYKSQTNDCKRAFQQMIDEGKIDPNEYSLREGANGNKGSRVIRTQTKIVNGKETVVTTEYTVHHVDFDLNTGMGRFQLVETDSHTGLYHWGGNSQLKYAYENGASDAIQKYNNAAVQANSMWNKKAIVFESGAEPGKNVQNVKQIRQSIQGGKYGAKVSTTPSSSSDEFSSPSFDYNFSFLAT